MKQGRDEFIERNMGLAHNEAHKLRNVAYSVGFEYEDVAGVALIGLIKACDNFDREKYPDIKFSTYAVPVIRGEILRAIRDVNKGGLRISRNAKSLAFQIRKDNKEYNDYRDIEKDYNVSKKVAVDALEYLSGMARVSSADAVVVEDKDGNSITIIDTIGMSSNDDYSGLNISDMLKSLNDTERKVALMTYEGYTQTEIGKKLNYTQVHISRILKRVRQKLMKYRERDIGDIA